MMIWLNNGPWLFAGGPRRSSSGRLEFLYLVFPSGPPAETSLSCDSRSPGQVISLPQIGEREITGLELPSTAAATTGGASCCVGRPSCSPGSVLQPGRAANLILGRRAPGREGGHNGSAHLPRRWVARVSTAMASRRRVSNLSRRDPGAGLESQQGG
jgi:hypothetical protein